MRLFVILAAFLAIAGCSVRFDTEEVPAVQTFPFTGNQLKITSSLGGLRVLPGTSPAVEVERWTRGKASASPSWSLRDGVLRLSAECTLVFGDCGARYHVKVPSGVRLVIDSPDGVILDGLTQDVDVSSGDRIQVKNASGKLRLLSDSGGIEGDGLKSPSVRGRTLDGSISLAFTAPPTTLDLKSREGGVTARVPKESYQVTVKSADGSSHSDIESTKSSNRTILVRSTYGNVRVLAK
ncbi:DUF4097 family beta strand repeat-containing protein [Nonomuraea spiralis]|uniref:DUF4097 family beta strand repeat-containing protein n=1 Tax=Nonomuraea spiralis TaxID=46182 RepID=A0ABV5ICR7_9ACTN|nr:DUF4097 family beta strand repeat-containing protein [Nonomuraea spiralis]